MKLLPDNFDNLVQEAVKHFWKSRTRSDLSSQEGGRSAVIGGKNMDGFAAVIRTVAIHCGLEEGCIKISVKRDLTLPGYFRPTKMWDAVVLYKGILFAAFELKSQVGSFGNNFNNRTEESLGSSIDFWTANRENAFHATNSNAKDLYQGHSKIQPFLGYLMLLEEAPGSTSRVGIEQTHFRVFSEYLDTSYAGRYQILCEKIVQENLYTASSLMLSNPEDGRLNGSFSSPTEALTPRSLFANFSGKIMANFETLR